MKKITQFLKISIFYLSISFLSISCNKEDNNTITDNIPTVSADYFQKEWSKLEIRFTKGHSHGYFHGNPDYPVKYLKNVQRFYFENKNGIITPASDNPVAIRWEGSNDQAGISLSGVELIFYDKNGKRINSLLSTGNNPNHYQFFFIADNFQPIGGHSDVFTQANVLKYKYRDTDPEELYIFGKQYDNNPNAPKGKLRKEQIGLKGFFEIKRAYVNFNLHIVLGYFNTKPENLAYNNLPENEIMQIKIPIHIYTDILAEDKAIEDAVREFGATEEEIKKDQNDILNSDLSPESSGTFL